MSHRIVVWWVSVNVPRLMLLSIFKIAIKRVEPRQHMDRTNYLSRIYQHFRSGKVGPLRFRSSPNPLPLPLSFTQHNFQPYIDQNFFTQVDRMSIMRRSGIIYIHLKSISSNHHLYTEIRIRWLFTMECSIA